MISLHGSYHFHYKLHILCFFPHKVKRKINIEYFVIEEMQRINLSFIFDLECFKVGAERFCYHIVDCCQNAIADEFDRVFRDGFS